MPEVNTSTVTANGVSLSYRDGGSGSPVFLVHGNVASNRWWDLIWPLLEAGHHLIAPDLRGFGRSEKPGTGYTIAGYARDLEALADSLGIRAAHWVGHSLGGSVVMQVALDRPDLVKSLVLVDTGPAEGLKTPVDRFPILEATTKNRDWMKLALVNIAATAPQGPYFEGLVDDAMLAGGVLIPNAVDLNQWNVQSHLGEIRVPTLLVMGEKDPLVPLDAVKRTAQGIAGSRLEVIPGITHSPPIERPDELARLILEFLDPIQKGG